MEYSKVQQVIDLSRLLNADDFSTQISSGNTLDDAIVELSELNKKEKNKRNRVDSIVEHIIEDYIEGRFSVSLPISKNEDSIDVISMGINTFIEELEEKTVSKDYFDDILNSLKDVVWSASSDLTKLNYINDNAVVNIFGIERKDISQIKQLFHEIVHPDDLKLISIQFQQFEGKGSCDFNYRIVHPVDQQLKWIRSRIQIIKSPEGEVVRVDGVLTDITKQKKNEEELSESKQQLQNFFDLSRDFMCVANMDATFKIVNDTFVRELGYSKAELENSPFVNFIHPDDLAVTYKEIEKLSKGVTTVDFENRYRTKEGEYIWLSWCASPDPKNGNLYATARNITLKKKNEAKLKAALNSVEDYRMALDKLAIVAVTNVKGDIIVANEQFSEITGYSNEELIGSNHRMLNSGHHPKEFFKDLWRTIAQGNVWRGEVCNKRKDGTEYWVDTVISPSLNDEGKPYQYFSIRTDITERKMREGLAQKNIELQKAKEYAEKSSKLKEQFLANMSHEIRTPLNAIVGIGSLLNKSTNLDVKQKKYLDVLSITSKNLLGIVNDILDFSKIEAEEVELSHQPMKLNNVLENVKFAFSNMAKEKGIDFILDTEKFNFRVLGDVVKLSQILNNLVSNAIKFTHDGSVTLHAKRLSETDTTIKIVFKIIDSGIGIPLEKQKSIFDAFKQENSETTRDFGGTGLGLSIVQKLVELHNSIILLTSKKNVGSEFSFVIEFEKELKQRQKALITKSNTMKPLEKLTILLAEDNEFNIMVAVDTIEQIEPSIEVEVVLNGKEAIENLRKRSYDLILLDLEMPELGGYDTAEYIRNELKLTIPIIGMSAHNSQKEINMCFEKGMNEYISKPFEEEELKRKLIELSSRDRK